MGSRGTHRPARGLVALAGLGLITAGCSLPFSGPDPADDARVASVQLARGKPGSAFTSGAQALWDSTVGGLGEPDSVGVGKVTSHGSTAEAQLSWRWQLGGQRWTYTSTLPLVRAGDHWRARLTAAAIEPSLKTGDHLEAITLKATRGRILGADGKVIVEPRPVSRIGIDKLKLRPGEYADAARRLATALGIDAAAYVKQVQAAGASAFVQAIVLRRGDSGPDWASVGVADGASVLATPGVLALSDHLPLPPTRDFGVGLIGSVGPATAEAIKKSDGRLRAGDDTGLSGLQQRYDESLGGTNGIKVMAVADGQRTQDGREVFSAQPTAGSPLRLTLDVDLQQKAQEILADVGPASALVAVRPSTGEILAAASGPGSKGYNTATFGQYAPGSTFKIVSSLALLRSGMRPDSPVNCPATTDVAGKQFKNYSDYPSSSLGDITLGEAVAQSCNTAFIGSRDKVTGTALADAAAALGLGVDHDTGFPAYFGQVPATDSVVTAAADLIGQGTVLASPMAMATVIASVQAGHAVLPTLVRGEGASATDPSHPLTDAEATQLRAMLRRVVEEGSGRGLADLPGAPVIAKTGTAEFGTDTVKTHAWLVAAQGDLAVAGFVDVGESGSQTAGPLVRELLASYDAR